MLNDTVIIIHMLFEHCVNQLVIFCYYTCSYMRLGPNLKLFIDIFEKVLLLVQSDPGGLGRPVLVVVLCKLGYAIY